MLHRADLLRTVTVSLCSQPKEVATNLHISENSGATRQRLNLAPTSTQREETLTTNQTNLKTVPKRLRRTGSKIHKSDETLRDSPVVRLWRQ